MHAKEKPANLNHDVILSFTLSSPRYPIYNALTIYSTGKVTYNLGYGSSKVIEQQLDFDSKNLTIEEYLKAHLPIDEFLSLNKDGEGDGDDGNQYQHHYYELFYY